MGAGSLGAALRVIALTALAVAIWGLARYGYAKPQVLGEAAPAAVFSAGRAEATLARVLGPEKPHPVSSDENAAVRARIRVEFAKLGVKTTTYTAFTCNPWRGFQFVPCATVTDVLAEVVPGEGKAVVLLAHYDSVPAGPGASDDESGTAIVLETARALLARGAKSKHPVLAAITDGEEAGLLGAQAFLQNPQLKARVGTVVNVEARGTSGRSLLFQTSPADSRLIGLYVKSVPFYATSSLFAEIYKLLPNDTDLTLFLKAGFPSFNFAFSDNVADYHTPLDTRANLSRLTLQQQGENMLGVASALTQTDYADLAGHDEVYLDMFGFVVPRMPAVWALPVALAVLVVLLFAAWRARGVGAGEWLRAALMPPAVLIACGAMGWLLHTMAQAIAGQPDPSYAYPIALREGLTFGVVAAVLLAARLADSRAATLSVWVWFAVLGVATAAFLPGISPYFLFPVLAAALIALLLVIVPSIWLGDILFAIPILIALAIWISLVATGEGLMGLKLHVLFTIPAGFAAMTLVPLIHAPAMRRGVWLGCIAVALGGALVATGIAGVQPAYSKTKAQRLSIRYVESGGKAKWALDAGAPLPAPLRAAAAFSKTPEPLLPGLPFADTYDAPIGKAQFAPPGAEIVADATYAGARRVTVALHGSTQAGAMFVHIPKSAHLRTIDIHGQHMAAPADNADDTVIACASRDCAQEVVSIETAGPAGYVLTIGEQRFGLPPFAAKLITARPKQAIPSQNGDIVVLANTLQVPKR
jgi:hypothetical protein